MDSSPSLYARNRDPAVELAGLCCWPRAFDTYVSPPIKGDDMCYSFLVPRGWGPDYTVRNDPIAQIGIVNVCPPDRPGWWPSWLRRLFPARSSRLNRLQVIDFPFLEVEFVADMLRSLNGRKLPGGQTLYVAFNSYHFTPDSTVILVYYSDNRDTLESTRDAIFSSFHLVHQPGQ